MSANYESALESADAFDLSVDGEFSEQITVTPYGGAARTVYAIINRDPPERVSDSAEVYKPTFDLQIRNSATDGLLASEVNRATATFNRVKGALSTSDTYPLKLSNAVPNPVSTGRLYLEI